MLPDGFDRNKPARVVMSADDGKTWTEIATTGIGYGAAAPVWETQAYADVLPLPSFEVKLTLIDGSMIARLRINKLIRQRWANTRAHWLRYPQKGRRAKRMRRMT
jgi:hypothetical protein